VELKVHFTLTHTREKVKGVPEAVLKIYHSP